MSVIKFGTWQALNGTEVANSTDPVGDGGLVFIKSQTIGGMVTSVTISSAFSSLFDSYKVVISGGTANGNGPMGMQIGSASTGYYAAYPEINYATAAITALADNNTSLFNRIGVVNSSGFFCNVDIINPFLNNWTYVNGGSHSGTVAARTIMGILADTNSYTGFTINSGSILMAGGTIRVYGYRN